MFFTVGLSYWVITFKPEDPPGNRVGDLPLWTAGGSLYRFLRGRGNFPFE